MLLVTTFKYTHELRFLNKIFTNKKKKYTRELRKIYEVTILVGSILQEINKKLKKRKRKKNKKINCVHSNDNSTRKSVKYLKGLLTIRQRHTLEHFNYLF